MDTALLVLDIQKDFVGDQARMPVAKHQIEPMLKSTNTIITKVSEWGIPVIYIGNEFEPKQFISNWFRNNAAVKGCKGTQQDERLLKVTDIYFPKNTGDALKNPELFTYLSQNDIDHLIIVGVFAEGCVKATANSAIRRNFSVTIVKDAVAGRSDKRKLDALNKMEDNGVNVVDSVQLFEMLSIYNRV